MTITALIISGQFNPTHGFSQGWHDSPKAGRVYYRSSYELRYYGLLDGDDAVLAYEVEPFIIPYEFNGATLNYIPDVLVFYADGHRELVEIKPKKLVGVDKNAAKAAAAEAYCDGVGLVFRVLTEDDLS